MIGVSQIISFSTIIEDLGSRQVPRQRIILELKNYNSLYAMGVRNYVFWKNSKFLQAASIASDIDTIEKNLKQFKNNLSFYKTLTVSPEQIELANKIGLMMDECEAIAKKLIGLLDSNAYDKDKVNNLLMLFENKYYTVDNFISKSFSYNNIKDIESQLEITKLKEKTSVIILFFSIFFSLVLGYVIAYYVYTNLKSERQKRELLIHKMIRMEEEERKNLSRQIHDQLSQDLTALKIHIELIKKEVPNNSVSVQERILKCSNMLGTLIHRSHNISELLRPPELDELGLVESIASLVNEYQEMTGAKYRFDKPKSEIKLSAEYSLAIYRFVQEAFTNIGKYAKAENVNVILKNSPNTIFVSVSDDGMGFNIEEYKNQINRRKDTKVKLGIQGLKERIEILGGTFTIESFPLNGTTLTAEFTY